MDSIEQLKEKSSFMITEFRDRNALFAATDQMYHGEYVLPGDLEYLDWFVKQVSTEPHDAIDTGVRALATNEPQIKYHPRQPGPENRARAGEIEQMLTWWLINAGKRRKAGFMSDLVKSAISYDTIALRVVHLPYMRKVKEQHGLGPGVLKQFKRYGPFAVIVEHPSTVFPLESDFGLTGVLSVQDTPVHEAVSKWGDAAKGIYDLLGSNTDPFQRVTVYDYMDMEQRAVWILPGPMPQNEGPGGKHHVVMEPTEHGLDFLPWVYRSGASNLATEEDKKLNPLLYAIYRTDKWLNKNLIDSTVLSEAMATAAQPMVRVTGSNPDTARTVSYEGPGGEELVQPGHNVEDVRRRDLDRALLELGDRFSAAMSNSTSVRFLQNPDLPSGANFSASNLFHQIALSALKPFKRLSEYAVSDICELMLLWVRENGEEEMVYSSARGTEGKHLTLHPDEIAPEAIYIDVNLVEAVPTDHVARTNAAVMQAQNLGISKNRVLEDLGYTDPEQVMQESYEEQISQALITNTVQTFIAEEQARLQGRLQAIQQAAAQQMQQQMAAQNPQAQPPPQAPRGAFPGGPGFNPAQGGTPPQQAVPGVNREQVNGADRGGNPL